jgi:hypothetical protein
MVALDVAGLDDGQTAVVALISSDGQESGEKARGHD